MAMNTSVFVEAIAGAVALVVAALSYFFTKVKEREADWRKWKYEQYKEFIAALSGNVGPNPSPQSQRIFFNACNTLNLIGSPGVLASLQSLIASFNANSPREENNARISRLIWEIRKDVQIPGTPGAEEFSARLWFFVPRAIKGDEGGSEI